MSLDWSKYPNFSEAELRCKHTGKCEMHPDFMARLQRLRTAYGKSLRITSGYRDRTHPVEACKRGSGAHTTGRAVDIAIMGGEALALIKIALEVGFTGIGIKQHGPSRFLHLDDLGATATQPRPWVWSYP
jgi:uncharacterized protein YcbK (DUF882 family)